MKLKVIKAFIGIAEGEKMLLPGQTIVTNDLTRINTLVRRGLCEIVEVEEQKADNAGEDAGSANNEVVEFNGNSYALDVIKAAMTKAGIQVAKNAKANGVNNALAKLNNGQIIALNQTLNESEE